MVLTKLLLLCGLVGLLVASGAHGYTVLLDIDLDGDPATLNESTSLYQAEVWFVLQPTEPQELITEFSFGLGGSCMNCPPDPWGVFNYGVTFAIPPGTWSTHPEVDQSWTESATSLNCRGNPGFHAAYFAVATGGGFVLDAPVFVGSTTAQVHEVVPPCLQPVPDLKTFPASGEPGNSVRLYAGGGIPIAGRTWGVIKSLYR